MLAAHTTYLRWVRSKTPWRIEDKTPMRDGSGTGHRRFGDRGEEVCTGPRRNAEPVLRRCSRRRTRSRPGRPGQSHSTSLTFRADLRLGDQAQLPDGAFLDVCRHSDHFQPARRLATRAPAESKKISTDGGRLISSERLSPGEGCARSLEPLALGGARPGGRRSPATASARPAPPLRCPHLSCVAGAFGSSGGGWQPRSIRYLANASRSRSGWNGSVPPFRSCASRSRS